MKLKLTEDKLEDINSAMADKMPHGVLYLRKGCFGTDIMYGDHYLGDINSLWSLCRELQIAVDVIKEEIGVYEEA